MLFYCFRISASFRSVGIAESKTQSHRSDQSNVSALTLYVNCRYCLRFPLYSIRRRLIRRTIGTYTATEATSRQLPCALFVINQESD